MARIRSIKPDFFTSEDITDLPPLARLLYIGLWCEADKEGRLAWKPKTFKMRYLPADACDIDALCDALLTRGLLVTYGDGLAFIPSFKKHQHINPRESASTFPEPTPDTIHQHDQAKNTDACSTRGDASLTHREEGRKGREGKEGKEETSEHSPDAPPKKKSGSPEDHETARWIYSVILKIDPTAKEPNWNSWANDIRLMREIDGRDHRSVCEMFDWASRHHFWCKNILSPGKLREKWGTLAVQRNGPDRSPPAARSAMNRIGIDSQTPEGWGDGSDI